MPLQPALYLVATPLGNARDITLRALDVLASADVLAAEDTRTLLKLMQIHGVPRDGRPMIAYHDHSGPQDRERLIGLLGEGKSVAYASEAGTPLVADPGYALVKAVADAGQTVVALPGPCAAIAALSVSGLPTDRFSFQGFPPAREAARRAWLEARAHLQETSLYYESPRRLGELLAEMAAIYGPDRPAVLAREITKKFEETRRDTLAELAEAVAAEPVRGECVLVVGGAPEVVSDPATVTAALVKAMSVSSVKDAVKEVAAAFDLPRKEVYQQALALRADSPE